MTFLTAMLWGSGLSIGMCVGLVVWTIVRTKVFEKDHRSHLAIQSQSLDALKKRNDLTVVTNNLLKRIALATASCVPFEQKRFLPEELEGKVHFADFVDYEADWRKTNRRRGKLIDKDIARSLTPSEGVELDGLQAYADYHLHMVAPRPKDEC